MAKWHEESNYLVALAADDESALSRFLERLEAHEIPHTAFREPDLGDELTAVALAPCELSKRLCSSFPLALRDAGGSI